MTEEGKKYTDLVYATKEDVKAILNRDNVDSSWEKVLNYRNLFRVECELRDKDFNPMTLTLSPKILSLCYDLEERLFSDLSLYHSLKRKELFVKERKIYALKALSRHCLNKMPNDSTLEKIASLEIENVPSSLFLLGEYSRLWGKDDLPFDEALPKKINSSLQGDSTLDSALLRKETESDVLNPLLPCPTPDIESQLSSLFLFLGQKEVPLLARAVSSLFFFLAHRPFEYVNEETGSLFLKTFLKVSGLSLVGYSLDFESVLFSHSEGLFGRLKESEKTLDLTYALTYILPFLSKDEEKIRETLENAKKEEELPIGTLGEETPVVEEKESLALPSFGKSEDGKTIEERARRLREIYPSLKRREAHFYAGHCRVGSYYSIEDFVRTEMSVYETGRSGMESLAKKGFYRKVKEGKKFLYTPIPIEGIE